MVHDRWTHKSRHGPWVKTVAEAKAIQIDIKSKLTRGQIEASSAVTVEQAGREWLADAKAGRRLTNEGLVYQPSTLRSYESSFELHIAPTLGRLKLKEVRKRDVQTLIDRLALQRKGSTVRNAINTLRVPSLPSSCETGCVVGLLSLRARTGRVLCRSSPQESRSRSSGVAGPAGVPGAGSRLRGLR